MWRNWVRIRRWSKRWRRWRIRPRRFWTKISNFNWRFPRGPVPDSSRFGRSCKKTSQPLDTLTRPSSTICHSKVYHKDIHDHNLCSCTELQKRMSHGDFQKEYSPLSIISSPCPTGLIFGIILVGYKLCCSVNCNNLEDVMSFVIFRFCIFSVSRSICCGSSHRQLGPKSRLTRS